MEEKAEVLLTALALIMRDTLAFIGVKLLGDVQLKWARLVFIAKICTQPSRFSNEMNGCTTSATFKLFSTKTTQSTFVSTSPEPFTNAKHKKTLDLNELFVYFDIAL